MSVQGDLLKRGIGGNGKDVDIFDGSIFANNLIPVFRNVYYVDAANGADTNSGKKPTKALATLAAAYNKCTAGQHDVVVILAGGTTLSLTAQFDWAKSYTHLIGVGANTPNSRARISSSGVGANAAFLVSATGCIFSNFRIFENTANASAGAIEVTGNRNLFDNVDIQGQANATAYAGANAFSLKLNGAEENRFVGCTLGLDTVVKTNGKVLTFDGASARNEFIDCVFKSACETAAIGMVGFVDTAGMDRYTYFKRCLFYNFWTNHSDKLTEVFTIPGSASTHDIILDQCAAVGADEWESNDRGSIWVIGGTPAAATTGIAVEPAV